MAHPKGAPKTPGSGRKKGTRNRSTLDVRAKLEAMGCDPIEGLARIARQAEEAGDMKLAHDCYGKLTPYIAPRLQQLDTNVKAEATTKLVVQTGAPCDAGPDDQA